MSQRVLGLMFDEARDNVLLINRFGANAQSGVFNGIDGVVWPGETTLQALDKECREAAGFLGEFCSGWQHVATVIEEFYPIQVEVFATFTESIFYAVQRTGGYLKVYPHRDLPTGRTTKILPLLVAVALDDDYVHKPVMLTTGQRLSTLHQTAG